MPSSTCRHTLRKPSVGASHWRCLAWEAARVAGSAENELLANRQPARAHDGPDALQEAELRAKLNSLGSRREAVAKLSLLPLDQWRRPAGRGGPAPVANSTRTRLQLARAHNTRTVALHLKFSRKLLCRPASAMRTSKQLWHGSVHKTRKRLRVCTGFDMHYRNLSRAPR